MDKINKSKYKMLFVPNALAIHGGGKSTKDNFKIKFIRTCNFKYGELIYAYKLKKSIFLKILKNYKNCKTFIMKQRKKDKTWIN